MITKRWQEMLSGRLRKVRWRARRLLCTVLACALMMQGFVSCAGGKFLGIGRGNKYVYEYSMVGPVKSQHMLFQNDSLKVQFSIDDTSVRFRLQNLTGASVRIHWKDVSIGVDNRYSWGMNSSTIYADSGSGRSSVPIPRLGYVEDLVIPSDNVNREGKQWFETDLFQTTDGGQKTTVEAIEKNIGKSIVLNLPLEFGGRIVEYRFVFTVTSVKRIPWSDVRTPSRSVPPTPKEGSAEIEDQVTTGFIVVGLLGFVIFMVSLKKEPVVE